LIHSHPDQADSMSELETKMAERRATIDRQEAKVAEETIQEESRQQEAEDKEEAEAEEEGKVKSKAESKKKNVGSKKSKEGAGAGVLKDETDETDGAAYRAALLALRDDAVRDTISAIVTQASAIMQDAEAIKAADSTSASASDNASDNENGRTGVGVGSSGGEVLYVSVASGRSLGVSVTAADVHPQRCGGLRVIGLPAPSSNIPPGGAGFQLHDLLLSANDTPLTGLSPAAAVGVVRALGEGGGGRRFTVLRRGPNNVSVSGAEEQAAAAAGAGADAGADAVASDSDKENVGGLTVSTSVNAGAGVGKSHGGKKRHHSEQQHEEEEVSWTESEGREAFHAMKKRVVQRASSAPLYAAGARVAVDYSRQRPPTMMGDFCPSYPRPLHSRVGPLGLRREPCVQALQKLHRSAAESHDIVSEL